MRKIEEEFKELKDLIAKEEDFVSACEEQGLPMDGFDEMFQKVYEFMGTTYKRFELLEELLEEKPTITFYLDANAEEVAVHYSDKKTADTIYLYESGSEVFNGFELDTAKYMWNLPDGYEKTSEDTTTIVYTYNAQVAYEALEVK